MLSIFVNGDSHTAQVYGSLAPTATQILAEKYHCTYTNIALPGGSNQRIIRTTQEQLTSLDPKTTLIIIGWSSFERTEWFFQDQWHKISGDPAYEIDKQLQELWHQHIDSWWNDDNHECWRRQADQHHAIWVFHRLLHDLGYEFVFYQGCKTFFFDGCPQQDQPFRLPWIPDIWAHDPYVQVSQDNERVIESFSHYAENLGYRHTDDRAHFGADAHEAWADYLDKLVQSKLHRLKERQK
jgi:hypothetical protein